MDNRGYAHVAQDLSEGAEFLAIPYRNASGQDPRNRRIIPIMTFFIPSTGGGGGGQYYQAKVRPQDLPAQLLLVGQSYAVTGSKGQPGAVAPPQRFNQYAQVSQSGPSGSLW